MGLLVGSNCCWGSQTFAPLGYVDMRVLERGKGQGVHPLLPHIAVALPFLPSSFLPLLAGPWAVGTCLVQGAEGEGSQPPIPRCFNCGPPHRWDFIGHVSGVGQWMQLEGLESSHGGRLICCLLYGCAELAWNTIPHPWIYEIWEMGRGGIHQRIACYTGKYHIRVNDGPG